MDVGDDLIALGLLDAVGVDEEPSKHGLVQLLPCGWWTAQVQRSRLFEHAQDEINVTGLLVTVAGQAVQPALGGVQLSFELGLLVGKAGHIQDFRQVGIKQPFLGTGQLAELAFCGHQLSTAAFGLFAQLSADFIPHVVGLTSGQCYRLPVMLHMAFHTVRRQIRQIAVSALLGSPQAVEIVVALAFCFCESQAGAAAPAEHRARQILLVLPRLVATELLAAEHGLDSLEGGFTDQWLM